MVKYLLIFSLLVFSLDAQERFEEACADCHKAEGIPHDALYKRYLLQYSSEKSIKKAMIAYLKNPSQKTTIMPPRFISRFGIKKPIILPDTLLEEYVDTLIKRYRVKDKFYIPMPQNSH